MRTCLGIFFGIIFLIVSSFFILTLNLNRTVYNAAFDKKAMNDSGMYANIPDLFITMVSNGQITANGQELSQTSKDIIVNIVRTVLTPETIKKHAESIVDQTLSDQIIVTEDLSDINNAVNSNLNEDFSRMMGISISSNPENSFVPTKITFDKNQNPLGKSIIYQARALWISLALTILFLVLLFFLSADNYKSRLKWTGGFLIAAGVFALINFLTFHFLGFGWLSASIQNYSDQAWTGNMSNQIINVLNIIKLKISFYYLVEAVFLTFFTIILFVIAAILPANKISNNTPKVASQNNNQAKK